MPGELIQISGAGGTNAACNGTYTFASFQGTPNDINLGRIIASTGSGGTILLNDDQGQINPLYDINHYGSSRFGGGGTSANLMLLAGWGVAGIRGYQGSSAVAAEGGWSHFWPDSQDGLGMQSVALGEPNQWLNNQQRWWDIAQGLNFLKRLSPFYLQTPGPAPFIAPGPPWVVTSLTTSAAYGNILNVISFSEAPQTILVPLGSACQIGTNPISVYRASFPYATADLLTGAQGNVSYTLDPGEAIAFACHANGTQSFVKPYTVTYAAPAGTVKTAVQVVYGNYAGPLQQYTRPSAICSASPCNINLDTGASDVYYKLLFMDAKGAVISTVGPINIPKGS
jgi:hypothetical protein